MQIRRPRALVLMALGALSTAACGFFDDPTPETLFFTLDGPAGTELQVVYSTQFVAGVNDFGVTQVQVFQADTVMQTLPIDTLFNISIDRRWFVEVTPVGTAQVSVEARVDVDDRNQLRETGAILAADPWRFAYLFNQAVTRTIDIVL